MKDAFTAFCRSGSPPAGWFGHEIRKSTAPNGGETSDDRPILLDEQVQDGPLLGGVASVVSPNLVMAGVTMMFVMGASSLLAIKLRRRRQPNSDGRGIPQLLSSHQTDETALGDSSEDDDGPEEVFYSLAELVDPTVWRCKPAVVERPHEREQFLAPDIFEVVFGMAKDDFAKLPTWQQSNLKKQHQLF